MCHNACSIITVNISSPAVRPYKVLIYSQGFAHLVAIARPFSWERRQQINVYFVTERDTYLNSYIELQEMRH
jgi:hypothetical protein